MKTLEFFNTIDELNDLKNRGFEMAISLGNDRRGDLLACGRLDFMEIYKEATGRNEFAEDDSAMPIDEAEELINNSKS